jgi:ribosomal-protein-alanine N-acetyltransferase
MVEIRAGDARDLGEIAAIQAASPAAAAWHGADYLEYDLRVAVCEKRVAGFLAARRVAEGEREILNLAVAPELRRQGIGRALMKSFVEGVSGDIFLEVRSSNSGALEFYKSLGFQELSLRQGYYEAPAESAIVMKFHSC